MNESAFLPTGGCAKTHNKKIKLAIIGKIVISGNCQVIPVRLERTTYSLEGCCSIQLSYGTVIKLSV